MGSRKGSGRKNEVSKVEDRVHPALSSRATRPNHFRRDVGRAGVRADLGATYRTRFSEHFRWQLITAKTSDCATYGVLMGMLPTSGVFVLFTSINGCGILVSFYLNWFHFGFKYIQVFRTALIFLFFILFVLFYWCSIFSISK